MNEDGFTEIELRRGAYVAHLVLVRKLPSGDLACVIECKIGGHVRSCWQVLVLADDGWTSSELISEDDAPRWWYGYANEGELIQAILNQL